MDSSSDRRRADGRLRTLRRECTYKRTSGDVTSHRAHQRRGAMLLAGGELDKLECDEVLHTARHPWTGGTARARLLRPRRSRTIGACVLQVLLGRMRARLLAVVRARQSCRFGLRCKCKRRLAPGHACGQVARAMPRAQKATFYPESGVWPIDDPGVQQALGTWPPSCRKAFQAARNDGFMVVCVRCCKFARGSVAATCRATHTRAAALDPPSTPAAAGAPRSSDACRWNVCRSPSCTPL